jgi:hypothetical protein
MVEMHAINVHILKLNYMNGVELFALRPAPRCRNAVFCLREVSS